MSLAVGDVCWTAKSNTTACARETAGIRTKLGAKYLRGKGPLALVFTAEAGTRAQASRLEARLKRLTKADKERLVRSERSLADMGLVEEL